MMYTVYCNQKKCTLYIDYDTLQTRQCTVNTVHSKLDTLHCFLLPVHCYLLHLIKAKSIHTPMYFLNFIYMLSTCRPTIKQYRFALHRYGLSYEGLYHSQNIVRSDQENLYLLQYFHFLFQTPPKAKTESKHCTTCQYCSNQLIISWFIPEMYS